MVLGVSEVVAVRVPVVVDENENERRPGLRGCYFQGWERLRLGEGALVYRALCLMCTRAAGMEGARCIPASPPRGGLMLWVSSWC